MLAVAGGKGGCGKTTTALGIARALASGGSRSGYGRDGADVTVVDADVDMPDLHVLTDTQPTPGIDALAAGEPIEQCRHRARNPPGVSIVPAGTRGGSVESGLSRLRDHHTRVVVDTPAGASVDVTRPLEIADEVLLVSTPTRESLVDAAKTAAIARSTGSTIVGVVLNRSDGHVDPTALLDCDVLAHVPTVGCGSPIRDAADCYTKVVRAISKRNV